MVRRTTTSSCAPPSRHARSFTYRSCCITGDRLPPQLPAGICRSSPMPTTLVARQSSSTALVSDSMLTSPLATSQVTIGRDAGRRSTHGSRLLSRRRGSRHECGESNGFTSSRRSGQSSRTRLDRLSSSSWSNPSRRIMFEPRLNERWVTTMFVSLRLRLMPGVTNSSTSAA